MNARAFRTPLFSLTFCALLVAGCQQKADAASATAATAPAGAGTPAPPQAGAEVPAAASAGGKQYTVVAETVTLKSGEKKVARLRIEPAKGMKFNAEFPTKFTVAAAPFARSERDKLSLKDGDVKIDDKTGVVAVPVVATAAGRGNLALTGRFSICNDEQCFVLSETLNLPIVVE